VGSAVSFPAALGDRVLVKPAVRALAAPDVPVLFTEVRPRSVLCVHVVRD
jgi:hypothetical protein